MGILHAVEARDPLRSQAAMERHLRAVRQAMVAGC